MSATVILGKGVYTYSDAAKLTRLRTQRVRDWFLGRGDRSHVFSGDYANSTEEKILSFRDLIEVFIGGQLRERGVSLQTIRKIHHALVKRWSTEHPFCRQEIRTSGTEVFTVGLDEHGREEIAEVLALQRAFPEVIKPFLDQLDYDSANLLAARWHIFNGVVIDPDICFGQPIIEAAGIPTHILATAFHANGQRLKSVADWYGVSMEDVESAVKFENQLAA